ncbi:MAG: S8 family serine peptidase, partial [Anaerolineae bacterium]
MKSSIKNLSKAALLICGAWLFLITTTSGMHAQGSGVKPIRLVSGDIVPAIVTPAEAKVAAGASFDGKTFKLIQFKQIPGDREQQQWAAAGLRLVDYLPDDTYFAVIEQGFDLDRLTEQAITIIEVADIFRFEPSLAGLIAQGGAADRLVISYYAGLDARKVMADLQTRGVVIQAHRDYSRQLDITLDPARLREVLALPFIQFAGLPPETPILEPYDHRNATGRANYVNTGYNSLNYNGAGVVVGIGESGTVDSLVDVKGRLTEMESGASSSHKIGVMQNAGGAGNLDPSNRNNAWGATFLSVVGSPDYAALYSSHNLRYTNHSYGVAISGGYDQSARDHDLRIATYPNHLVIYSSGNSGDEQGYAPYNFAGCPGAPSDCWANITGQMKQNKDMFAIGALELDDDLTSFSSRGPMYDGRIIPQLVIEGIEGTSDAAPKVTGEVAMLAQVYKAKNSGSEPTSSLLRAIMMNTADDLGNAGPDFKHGYGRPNLRRAYNVIDNAQFLTGSVSHGGTNSHTITVPANTKQVRVMIVWPDVAAAVSANPAIV